MDLSVIIPVLNGADTIDEQLRALSMQRFDGAFEVIVVDNGSTDTTVEIVRAHITGDPRIRLVDGSALPRSGGAARNEGAAHALAPLLAFCDADDVVQPGWLAAIAGALQTEDVVQTAREYWSLNPQVLRRTQPRILGEHSVCGLPGLAGGAFGIRRDVFLSIHGFDTRFVGAEDSEFAVRLAKNGYHPGYLPDVEVAVRLRDSARDTFRRSRVLRSSVRAIRDRYGIPHPRPWRVAKRLLWLLRYLILTAPYCISPRGRSAWMNRAGELVADLCDVLRQTRARATGIKPNGSEAATGG